MAGRPGLAWDWSSALLGAAYAVPAGLVAVEDARRGLATAVGVLPAAIAGLPARRRGRRLLVALGVLTGVPMFGAASSPGSPSSPWPRCSRSASGRRGWRCAPAPAASR